MHLFAIIVLVCISQTIVMFKDLAQAITFGLLFICTLFSIDKIDYNGISTIKLVIELNL